MRNLSASVIGLTINPSRLSSKTFYMHVNVTCRRILKRGLSDRSSNGKSESVVDYSGLNEMERTSLMKRYIAYRMYMRACIWLSA